MSAVHDPIALLCRALLAGALPSIVLLSATAAAQEQPAPSRRSALDRAVQGLGSAGAPAAEQTPPVRLTDLSLDILGAFGAASERDEELGDLQGGGHDPRKRGFTLQQAELTIAGAVDPYFTAQASLVAHLDPIDGETVVELEEAYMKSTSLPADLQLKAGQYLTEFGRINPTHPHAWDWQDQPIIATRVFGPDGMRGPGARLSWLVPVEQFVELTAGVQNANGETMASFLANEEFYGERPVGGRFFTGREVRSAGDLVYSLRAETTFDSGEHGLLGLGASAATGPNATGGGGDTVIYGADLKYRWQGQGSGGRPFLVLQGEVIARAFDAEDQVDQNDPALPGDDVAVPGGRLDDYGFYLQGLYGFTNQWSAGLRGEWASGGGASYDAANDTFGRASDPFRADRVRISPLLAYHPSEFSRFRLQYNYDDSDHLGDAAHSVWLGFEVLIGTHPPHRF